MSETVNHPEHYGGDTVYETIKVLGAWGLDNDFCLGNCVKYLSRAGKKNDALLEDLRKAAWYLARKINNLEKSDAVQERHRGKVDSDSGQRRDDSVGGLGEHQPARRAKAGKRKT